VDWSSKSVVELEAFLRSRGVNLGGECDKATLVEAASAIAAEEEGQHEQQKQGRPGAYPDGKHSSARFSRPHPQCKDRPSV
jgi:hypothetical protein